MGIRDWLAIIVIVFIVLILLDGFRRKWLDRRNRIVMKLDRSIPKADVNADAEADPLDPLIASELPNGGARTVSRSGEDPAAEEEVPVLMESVDLEDEDIDLDQYDTEDEDPEPEVEAFEERLDEEEDIDDPWSAENSGLEENLDEEEPELDVAADDHEEPDEEDSGEEHSAVETSRSSFMGGRPSSGERIEPSFGDEELTFGRDDQGELDLEHHDLFEHEASDEESDEEDEQEQAEEVIIINVMARADSAIEGRKLLPVLLRHGMRLGEMSIFHRHADSDGKGPVMFSMANMLKPGTFTLSEMETFTTPGVSFFMQLPNKVGNMQCFEQMLNTAQAVQEELDAVLKDENRSVFTRQTIEHSRQRIRDFELEMLARK